MTKNNKINLRDEFLSIRAKISEKARKLKSREVCKNFYSNISIKQARCNCNWWKSSSN